MISARTLIDEVSRYLVDQDPDAPFEHWSEDDLLTYLRLAVGVVASLHKDNFMRRTIIHLVEGRVQDVPADCDELTSVLGQPNEHGVLVAFPRRTAVAGLNVAGIVGCPDCEKKSAGAFKVDSWQYDENNPRILYVTPPVPAGADARLELSCFQAPSVAGMDSEIPLGAHFQPAIFELMLYYAYGVDTESVPSRDRAAAHWANAQALLGLDARGTQNKFAATRTPELRIGARK